ncbi:unnamed protein product [Prorocentrum cordatum]|uniref:Uncharacterized protein n=1 Tax=Prorocentrum cordatum TaxID=2364126 RepID=A0ABN9VYE2_9DINO|nr:unnamed protein product [Polarella glacialis]
MCVQKVRGEAREAASMLTATASGREPGDAGRPVRRPAARRRAAWPGPGSDEAASPPRGGGGPTSAPPSSLPRAGQVPGRAWSPAARRPSRRAEAAAAAEARARSAAAQQIDRGEPTERQPTAARPTRAAAVGKASPGASRRRPLRHAVPLRADGVPLRSTWRGAGRTPRG